MKFEWEIIHKKEEVSEWLDVTTRAKVIGGWLVRHQGASSYQRGYGWAYATEAAMVFISDPYHEWEIE